MSLNILIRYRFDQSSTNNLKFNGPKRPIIIIKVSAISRGNSKQYRSCSGCDLWSEWCFTCSKVALSEDAYFIREEGSCDRVQHTVVVEQGHISLFPVDRVDQLRCDAGPLQPVDNFSDLLQVLDDSAVCQVQLLNRRWVDLQSELASHRVAPRHWQDLDLLLVDRRELGVRQLAAFRDHSETVGARLGTRHPDVWVRRILDLCGASELLVGVGEDVVHLEGADEGGAAAGYAHLVVASVVVAKLLELGLGDLDRHERGNPGSVQVVQGGVDVPAVEASSVTIIVPADGVVMEGLVVRVLQGDVLQALKFLDGTIANDLDLGLVGNGLEVWVQDRLLCVQSLAVAIADGRWVEQAGKLELCLRGKLLLSLEEHNVVLVECLSDDGEVYVTDALEIGSSDLCAEIELCACRRRDLVDGDLALNCHCV